MVMLLLCRPALCHCPVSPGGEAEDGGSGRPVTLCFFFYSVFYFYLFFFTSDTDWRISLCKCLHLSSQIFFVVFSFTPPPLPPSPMYTASNFSTGI